MTITVNPPWTFQNLLDEAIKPDKQLDEAIDSSKSPEEKRVASIVRDNLQPYVIEWFRTAVNGKIMSSEAVSYLEEWVECFYSEDLNQPCCQSMRRCKQTAYMCYIWRNKEEALDCPHNVP